MTKAEQIYLTREYSAESETRELTPMFPAGLRIERRTIDAEQATYWLAVTNVRNRPMNQAIVKKYAQDMNEGRWKRTHQGIAFDCMGRLVDGQHTLAAIRASGKPQELTVTYGLDPDAFEVIDQTYKRTAGHTLAAEGVKAGKRVGALARTILSATLKRSPTHPEVIAYAHAHLEALQRYALVADQYSAAVAAAFAYADVKGLSGVKEAAERLRDLRWDSDGDPMRALAKALSTMHGRTGAKNLETRFWTTYNTLRCVAEGRELTVARRMDHGPN